MVGLTTSGGGYRSLLVGAGVIQGFDARDSDTGVSGVFQGLTYEAGLSGGAWLLSSFAANDWPTISSLQTGLWEQAFFESLLVPGLLLGAGPAYAQVVADIVAKEAAGFPPTLTDPWGRLLSYQLLYGPDGGVADTDSGLAQLSNFTNFNIPYPIITAIGVPTPDTCVPDAGATQYEIHPVSLFVSVQWRFVFNASHSTSLEAGTLVSTLSPLQNISDPLLSTDRLRWQAASRATIIRDIS